jgi:hypothetical protein
MYEFLNKKKKKLKGKNMKLFECFKMFGLLNFHGLNQLQDVTILLTKCGANCSHPMKVGIDY